MNRIMTDVVLSLMLMLMIDVEPVEVASDASGLLKRFMVLLPLGRSNQKE